MLKVGRTVVLIGQGMKQLSAGIVTFIAEVI